MQLLTEEQIEQLKNFLALKALCALCNSLQDALKKESEGLCTLVTKRLILDIALRTKDVKENSNIATLGPVLISLASIIYNTTVNKDIADFLQEIYETINAEYWKISEQFGIHKPEKQISE